jgi:general secretion pathway protein E
MTTPDMTSTDGRLARALVEQGLLTQEQSHEVWQASRQPGQRTALGEYVVQQGMVSWADLLQVLGQLYHLPVVQVYGEIVDPEAIKMVPERLASRYNVLPLRLENDALLVATADPLNIQAIDDLRAHTRRRINLALANPEELREAIQMNFRSISSIEQEMNLAGSPEVNGESAEYRALMESVNQTPIVRTVDSMIAQAVKDRASDIHIQPQPEHSAVRYRIDGIMHQALSLPMSTHPAVIARIKVMAQLNPTEHRHPQDGQFAVEVEGQTIDIRLATVASVYGEMAEMRILSRRSSLLPLTDLGFASRTLESTRQLLRRPYGMVLIAGPTGAGKTTSLYASLGELDKVQRNIITIEDPVEYRFNGITQLPVSARYGVTFASGLRAIMRLDPDIILVGEIRDSETAQIAVQAALTGHLVLSSIHANDAVGAIFRLLNLGADRFMVSAALLGIIAQRMVRKVCRRCGKEQDCSLEEGPVYQRVMQNEQRRFIYGTGCSFCARTGFYGRTGIFELMETSEAIQDLVLRSASASEVRKYCTDRGMVTMLQDGMEKARQGVTTPAEVIRHAFSLSSPTTPATETEGSLTR